jgi:hypothetical protein
MAPMDFQRFLERYAVAAKEWMNGNPKPWLEICSDNDDVTTFEAWGGFEKGMAQVGKRYESEALLNKGDGDVSGKKKSLRR